MMLNFFGLCCGFSYEKLKETTDLIDDECPICMEETKLVLLHKCKHKFCKTCITHWCSIAENNKSPECPLCRAKIRFKKIFPNYFTINN